MKITPCNPSDFQFRVRHSPSDNLQILMDFINSDCECAKVEQHTYKTVKYGQSSLCGTIKRHGLRNVGVSVYNGEIYLYRKNLENRA